MKFIKTYCRKNAGDPGHNVYDRRKIEMQQTVLHYCFLKNKNVMQD